MRIRNLMLLLVAFVATAAAARGSANFTSFVAIGDSGIGPRAARSISTTSRSVGRPSLHARWAS
jgi:hypothetical protein